VEKVKRDALAKADQDCRNKQRKCTAGIGGNDELIQASG
jgi:hypothetical protein